MSARGDYACTLERTTRGSATAPRGCEFMSAELVSSSSECGRAICARASMPLPHSCRDVFACIARVGIACIH